MGMELGLWMHRLGVELGYKLEPGLEHKRVRELEQQQAHSLHQDI